MNVLQSLCVAAAGLALGLSCTPDGALPDGLAPARLAAATEPAESIYIPTGAKPDETHALLHKHAPEAQVSAVAGTAYRVRVAAETQCVAQRLRARL